MPQMETEPGTASPSAIAISWLAASAAIPLTLITAVFGQGIGALAGGCHWIGASVPIGRQVWALDNQPVLNFSSLPGAGGYWLGSTAVPLVIAITEVSGIPYVLARGLSASIVFFVWTFPAQSRFVFRAEAVATRAAPVVQCGWPSPRHPVRLKST